MDSYRSAGVDIDRGDRFVEFIKSIRSRAVDPGIGGFSAALPIDTLGFRSPVLMTTTDGPWIRSTCGATITAGGLTAWSVLINS